MKSKYIVLYTKPYRIVNEDGSVNEGISMMYYPAETLEPVSDKDGGKGNQILQQSMPIELLSKIKTVPAVYEIEFGIKPIKNANGVKVPGIVPVGLDFVSDFSNRK